MKAKDRIAALEAENVELRRQVSNLSESLAGIARAVPMPPIVLQPTPIYPAPSVPPLYPFPDPMLPWGPGIVWGTHHTGDFAGFQGAVSATH